MGNGQMLAPEQTFVYSCKAVICRCRVVDS
jgi:hypothetical protein